MTGNWLAPQEASQGPLTVVPGDYRYVEDVVRIQYPIREARLYLKRHLGNPVRYRLVEARRGERVGHVREAQIVLFRGGNDIRIRAVRTLPDGTPASYFAPDELVETRATVETASGSVPPLNVRDEIVLHVPVRSYLRFLPGIYQGAVPARRTDIARVSERSARQWGARTRAQTTAVTTNQADQFRRFLFIFQHLMTTVTDKIDGIPSLTDPATAEPKFLPWIASWVGFELDESLPLHQQRELVRRSIRLYRTRGTKEGVEEMIRVLTSAPVTVEERKKPAPMVLGGMTLAGGRTPEERYHGDEPPPNYILRPDRAHTSFFVLKLEHREAFRERFGERASTVLRRISQIVTAEKPAHVSFTIQFEESVS